MLQNLKNIAVVSLSTVGSRVLGLLRDILIFAALGAGLWSSAFILAFTLPNLFRRLLGEGALTSAMVPVFSDILERSGKESAFRFFNLVLWRLCLLLVILVTLGATLLVALSQMSVVPERWQVGAGLSAWLLPYMWFICLAAIVSAGLNLLDRFAAAALTPVLLNLSMIGAIGAGFLFTDDRAVLVRWLCGGVLVGGALQLLVPAWDFARQGWRPRIERESMPELAELWRLFLPGLMGAAILQVNILVSRLLAYSLNESAASLLYLSSRLMELPLGIFTVAVATVFFPQLAKAQAAGNRVGFAHSMASGMRLVVGISLPAGVGLCVLGRPILDLLFQWGAFDAADVAATLPLIVIYGAGLAFYSAATFATRGLHAGKDMRTPVRIAAWCLLINALSGLILMQFFGASGLAAANVIAAVVQAIMLWQALSRSRSELAKHALWTAFGKIAVASVLMGGVCYLGRLAVGLLELENKLSSGLIVALVIPAGAAFYFACLALLRFEEMELLKGIIARFIPKRSGP